MDKKLRIITALFAIVLSVILWTIPLPIAPQAQIVLAILVFTMIFWFTEILPLHVTSLLAAFLLITLGGFTPQETFAPFFDPVVVLIFGGFVLALGMQKHKLDETITYTIVNKVGASPGKILFGIMALTAFLSMWMTNTASTAVILPIALIILAKNNLKPLSSNFGKAIVLGVAYAATLGGIGTLIGSTPNAMSAKFLADNAISLSFLDWMFYAMPLVLIMIPVTWFVLMKLFKPEINSLKTGFSVEPLNKNQKLVSGIFIITVALWLTTTFTGLNNATIALVPFILLYILGLLKTEDISKINWAALLLFGGGLALGTAIHTSGLDLEIAKVLESFVINQPYFLILLIVIAFAFILSIAASNTASAAIMLPLVIPLALLLNIDPKILVVAAAIGVSLDFIVPVGTPPNTIAYSSGYIKAKDMAISGLIIAVIGILVLTTWAYLFW
ncbi:MAG: DASS family sodium-coupled anion symporter [Candidatus Diapherotrites archaeon]